MHHWCKFNLGFGNPRYWAASRFIKIAQPWGKLYDKISYHRDSMFNTPNVLLSPLCHLSFPFAENIDTCITDKKYVLFSLFRPI